MIRDLNFILRSLFRRKQYSFLVVLILGLGLGLSTAAYSMLHGRFLRGLPYPGGEHLQRVHKVDSQGSSLPLTLEEFEILQTRQHALTQLGAWHGLNIEMKVGTSPAQRYNGAYVGEDVLRQLGVQPKLGRHFRAEEFEVGAESVVLLGHTVWRQHFADRDPTGSTVSIYGKPATVIGVMPAQFAFPLRQEVWLPLRQSPNWEAMQRRLPVQVVGMGRDHLDVVGAQRELSTLLPAAARAEGVRIRVEPYTEAYSNRQLKEQHVKLLALLVGLLVLCAASVANLMMTRTLERSTELSLRTSLGAPVWQVMRLVLLESLVLAVTGAIVGVAVAWLSLRGYLALTGPGDQLPFWASTPLDFHVYFVSLVAAVSLGLACGAIPAWTTLAVQRDSSAVRQGRSDTRMGTWRRLLVVMQIALCVALLLASALVVQSFFAMLRTGWGFDPQSIVVGGLDLYSVDLPDDSSRLRLFDRVRQQVEVLPGVEALGWTYTLPGSFHRKGRFALEGRQYEDDEQPRMRFSIVSPGFFDVFDVRPLQGRLLESRDRLDAEPVTLVDAAFAHKYFPEGQVLGKRIQVSGVWRTIVGVVPNLLLGDIEGDDMEALYLPLPQYPVASLHLVVRSRERPATLIAKLRREVARVVPDRPLTEVQSLSMTLAEATRPYRASAVVFSAVGGLALILAVLGLYANLSGFVSHRRKEIGIRMALGADRRSVLAWVLTRGGLLLAAGLALGLVVSLNLTHVMASFLYKMSPWAPGLFATVAAALAFLGLLACLIPAVKAARLDPASLLRGQ